MRYSLRTFSMVPLVAVFAACNSAASAADATNSSTGVSDRSVNEAAAKEAKVAYLAGINSNDINQYQATIADDVVYMAPNSPAMVGKTAVVEWVRGYLDAYQTSWEKTTKEFVVVDDMAYEWYRYRSVDTPKANGPAAGTPIVADSGNGINIYRRNANGEWLLARDSWATEKGAAQ